MLFICLFSFLSFLSSLSDLIGRVFGRFKQTLGGKRGCRVDSKYLFCNHKYSPMRNLPFPAGGSPRQDSPKANTNDGNSVAAWIPNAFLFIIICGICRFPQAGAPRQDSPKANTNDGKLRMPRTFLAGVTKKAKRQHTLAFRFFGSPMRNRTADSAVRGQRLNRLTMRPSVDF